jgi:DNA adenine methylase
MKYVGSKNKIAKEILPIMLAERKQGQTWVAPFVGGCNMIDKVDGPRIGADFNESLVAMWLELQRGWIPPDFISEEQWKDVRDKMDQKYPKHEIAFTRLGCSFGADWNGGYARNVRKDRPRAELLNRTTKSYCKQSKNNILKGVRFVHSSYDELPIPHTSLIYCDPPYAGTTGYKDSFNHIKFWEWCRVMAKKGHTVFISEYNAPYDFVPIWQKEVNSNLNNRETKVTKKAVEKLFMYRGF